MSSGSSTPSPYYVVAAPYLRWSAGIKVLHLLCDALNRTGQAAYMILCPEEPAGGLQPKLLTPRLDPDRARRHFEAGTPPIVIYPETVSGNPARAPLAVRYVLNFPGLLGGDGGYAPDELVFGYSRILARAAGAAPQDVLFLPASDPETFHPGAGGTRSGTCFYAAKYRDFHGGRLFDVTRDSVEILRDRPEAQTPQQIAELFRRSELFYCYENSALAIEATLCGCPVVFLPNPHLTEVIASEELGWDGVAWGTDPREIARAKATVQRAREHYLRARERFDDQLDRFVRVTQARAATLHYEAPVSLRFAGRAHVVRIADLLQQQGRLALARKSLSFLRRRGLGQAAGRAISLLRNVETGDLRRIVGGGTHGTGGGED